MTGGPSEASAPHVRRRKRKYEIIMGKIWARSQRAIICLLATAAPGLCDRLMYLHRFHRHLDMQSPETLNEKILWLKRNVYSRSKLVSKCADKYRVREYVRESGCGDILNELYGVYETPEEIDWDALPDAFVIKYNHGCGYNLLCPEKVLLNIPEAMERLRAWGRADYWRMYAELQYKEIKKKIICEKYLGTDGVPPTDYKVYCFNGRPMYTLACEDRGNGKTHFYFFDNEWKFCPITHDGLAKDSGFTLPRPKHFSQMIDCAERLSKPFPFVRVDFFDTEEKLVFGELTFTPSAGLDTDRLPETDIMFGNMLRLPQH